MKDLLIQQGVQKALQEKSKKTGNVITYIFWALDYLIKNPSNQRIDSSNDGVNRNGMRICKWSENHFWGFVFKKNVMQQETNN